MLRAGWFISKWQNPQRGCNMFLKSNKGRDRPLIPFCLLPLFPEIPHKFLAFFHFFKSLTIEVRQSLRATGS